jgi:LacI family transcriptional regulator
VTASEENPGRGVTMQQVADQLGISLSTVSLALRGKPVIARETRERVMHEAKRLGYVYNRSAANLRQRKRTLVGLVVPDITNPFVGEAALGLQSELAGHGQFVVLANTRDSVATQTEVISSLIEERVAGLVLIPAIGTRDEDLRLLRDSATPAVLMNREVPNSDLPIVGTDDRQIVRLAIEHLRKAHGVTEASYFGGMQDAGPHQARKAAFDRELLEHGIRNMEAWNVTTGRDPEDLDPAALNKTTGPNPAAAYTAALSLLERHPLPQAILCHSDSIAMGLIRALDEKRVPPQSCAIVSIDGIAASAMTTPPLTTVAVDPGQMGRDCGRLLLTPSERDGTHHVPLKPRLILRRSCGCEGRGGE